MTKVDLWDIFGALFAAVFIGAVGGLALAFVLSFFIRWRRPK